MKPPGYSPWSPGLQRRPLTAQYKETFVFMPASLAPVHDVRAKLCCPMPRMSGRMRRPYRCASTVITPATLMCLASTRPGPAHGAAHMPTSAAIMPTTMTHQPQRRRAVGPAQRLGRIARPSGVLSACWRQDTRYHTPEKFSFLDYGLVWHGR